MCFMCPFLRAKLRPRRYFSLLAKGKCRLLFLLLLLLGVSSSNGSKYWGGKNNIHKLWIISAWERNNKAINTYCMLDCDGLRQNSVISIFYLLPGCIERLQEG